jgi:hypothetical protein
MPMVRPSSGRQASIYSIFPLQPACPHLQSTSGVFSIAAHSVLQYFPDVTLQEQTGWAHFLLSSNAIWYLLLLNQPKDWMCASKERRHANPRFCSVANVGGIPLAPIREVSAFVDSAMSAIGAYAHGCLRLDSSPRESTRLFRVRASSISFEPA